MASPAILSSLLVASTVLLAAVVVHISHASVSSHHLLHFYMHDDYAGPHPTAMRVVSGRSFSPPNASAPPSPRLFGDIVVFSNALTAGPGRGTARVGTAQGFGVRVAERGLVTDLSMYLVLEDQYAGGGTVAVKGRIDIEAEVRESVVIGGTGRFRSARGYVLTRNYGDYDLAKGGTVEIDVYVH